MVSISNTSLKHSKVEVKVMMILSPQLQPSQIMEPPQSLSTYNLIEMQPLPMLSLAKSTFSVKILPPQLLQS